jgi:hypothetical protein
MNNGALKQDVLFSFLNKLKIYEEDMGKRNVGEEPLVDQSIFELFGDVKNLIEKEWAAKLHYIEFAKVQTKSK